MIKHKIALEGMEFFAHHGLHPKELEQGNNFLVDIELETDFTKAAHSDEISGTFDYEQVYAMVELEMKIPSKLLEHLAERILRRIQMHPSTAFGIKVTLTKLSPPLKGKVEKAIVEIAYKKK